MRGIITLTTDFGAGSPYIAQMKGVILSICREVDLIDISHTIGPQDIREGAIVLADATPRFPKGTIHLAVVDPGVGTTRRLVCAEIGGQHYVAPDNGVLSLLALRHPPTLVIAIDNRDYWLPKPSLTFHGRDIMAPVAAHLARGVDPRTVGQERDWMVALDWPLVVKTTDSVTGQVLYVDSFGNLITNITRQDMDAVGEATSLIVDFGGRRMRGIILTYGAAMNGETVALFDSQGRLEIAVVGGNAAKALQIGVGEKVVVAS